MLFLIASMCLWCYTMIGFFGIACGAVGFISAPVIILSISMSGTIVEGGLELASVASVYG